MMHECVGLVKKILFESKDFQILSLLTEKKRVRVKMFGEYVTEGENISVSGVSEHSERYGLQLNANSFERVRVQNSLLKEFICEGNGIGEATANRLIEAYPDSLIDLLDAKDYRSLSAIERVSQAASIVIINNWHKQNGKAKLVEFVDGILNKVSPKLRASIRRSALKAFAIYNEETIEKLTDDPFRIWTFSTYKNAEIFAFSLGVTLDDERRLMCAAQEVLHKELERGSTIVPRDEFLVGLSKLLGREFFINAYDLVCAAKGKLPVRIVAYDEPVESFALPGVAQMESYVEGQLRWRLEAGITAIDVPAQMIEDYHLPSGDVLSDEQIIAVKAILANAVTIISGGGGTGKTSVLFAVNDLIKQAGLSVVQVALAGKASQRLIQQTEDDAYTITSLLAKIKKSDKFLDSLECPVLHIDEASMVDVHTMYKVLKAFEGKPIRLNMVGDWAQLAPIGPGIIFHKLIRSNSVTTVELTRNFRSTLGIKNVAESIKKGVSIQSNKDVELIEYSEKEELQCLIESTYQTYSDTDLHVVAATKNTVASINIGLHKLLRKRDRVIDFAPEFSLNDDVIYKRNNEKLGLVNGSCGKVICGATIRRAGKYQWPVDLVVDFKLEGQKGLILSDIKDSFKGEYHLQHAYAITCHSAQGSEFDVVIVVVEDTLFVERSWLYTAITRAKKKVIVISKKGSIDRALSRGFSFEARHTRLYID
jgi:exodeoxyribonuclease V alpha subunit